MTPETLQTVQIAGVGAAVALAVVALAAIIYAAARGEAGRVTDALTWLRGKKTYLLAAAITGLEGAAEFGLMDPDQARKIETFLVIGVIATFRAAVTKVEQATVHTVEKVAALPPKETT